MVGRSRPEPASRYTDLKLVLLTNKIDIKMNEYVKTEKVKIFDVFPS